MSVLAQVGNDLARLFQESKQRLGDAAVSIKEVLKHGVDMTGQMAVIVEATGATGDDKRAAVLAAVGKWYDEVIEPLDIPYVPDFVADPLLKSLVLTVADKSIDGIVALLNRFGKLGRVAA